MKELIVKDDTKPGRLAKVIALSPERRFLVKCIGANSDIVLLKIIALKILIPKMFRT